MVKLVHKRTGIVLYKFGITKSYDIMDRFDHTRYPERARYVDFNISPIFSLFTDNKTAMDLEEKFLGLYPKIDLNNILNENYNSRNLTGITEIRLLDEFQAKCVMSELYKLKKRK